MFGSQEGMIRNCFFLKTLIEIILQKVYLLPKTVLVMADSEILNGGAFCYKQNKGWYKIYFFCKLYTSHKAQLSHTLLLTELQGANA